MKQVLLFTQIYPPRQGGAATFYSNLVRENQATTNFFVVCEFERGEKVIDHRDGAILYRVLPKVGWLPQIIQVPLEAIILFAISVFITIIKNIDIIHTHASRVSILGLSTTAMVLNKPIIYDCRDTGFRPRIIRIGPTPVWFSCASNIDQLLVESGVPEEKIIRLPVVNPEYVRQYRDTQIPERRNELIYIGTIVKRKGVFLLLSAVETILGSGTDVHLTVIGDGPATSEFDRICRQKDLGNHITRVGRLKHDETLRKLTNADILILPSEAEGVPRVVLEGQEVGTPVVATSVGGIPDVISHEKNGMLMKQTPESVAKNVFRLIDNNELYHTILKNGIDTANERSWKQVGKQLQKGYNRALNYEK